MPHIERVYLQVPSRLISLSDVEAQEVSRAWPRLKGFNVDSHNPQFDPSWALSLIAPFVRSCPDLEVLRLSCEVLEPRTESDILAIGSMCLRQLEVALWGVEIQRPKRLAEQLSLLCPNLDMNLSLQYDVWRKVRGFMANIPRYRIQPCITLE